MWQRCVVSDEKGKRYRFLLGHLDLEGGNVHWRSGDTDEGEFDMEAGAIEIISVVECGTWEMGERSITLNCGAQDRILSGNAEDVAWTVESLDRLFKRTAKTMSAHHSIEGGRATAHLGHAETGMKGVEKIMVGASTAPGPHWRQG